MQLYGWCDQHLMVRLMEYGYSSTIIASVEISALLFFPYPLEWVECDSWAFNKLHEFQILFSHNMGDMACSRCRQGVGSLVGWNGISGVFKTWGPGFTRCLLGLLCISTKNRGPLSVQYLIINHFAFIRLLSQHLVQDLNCMPSHKKIFTNILGKISFDN